MTVNDKTEKSGIDAEKFGNFIAAKRREKGLTQKQLAEQLYLSNKAVSKWERGLSMPDIAVLEPLADALSVTVTELLHGEKEEVQNISHNMTAEELQAMVAETEGAVVENRKKHYEIKKKHVILYLAGFSIAWMEVAMLYLLGQHAGITSEQISLDVLLIVCLPLFFGIWFFFFIREKLPAYYDTEKISYYSDGIFHMNMSGVYFNNKNWPYILKAGRAFCFFTPIFWPVVYFAVRLLIPYEIWRWVGLYVELFVILGGLFIPMTVMGKKHEK